MPRDEASPPRVGRRIAALVRHGHFDRPSDMPSAHLPTPLSARGRDQARAAARTILEQVESLGAELDERLESSQLLRAHETATVLASALRELTGRTFEVEDRMELLERGLGSCANLTFGEIAATLARDPRLGPLPPEWRRIPDFRLPVPGAESLLEAGAHAAARLRASLDEVAGDAGSDRVRLFVAHGGCLRHAAVHLGALEVGTVSRFTMDYAQAIYLERRSDTEWVKVAGDWVSRAARSAPVTADDRGTVQR
ncbi:MAG: histidine phosphatase family protein [Myxococcota bacterium]